MRNHHWILHYVKSARAVTDVPDHVRDSSIVRCVHFTD